MQKCFDGGHIKEATLCVRKAGENPLEYLTIVMSDVIVTAVSTGGSGGEDRLTENVTLNFEKIAWTYTEDDAPAGGAKTEHTVTWDIPNNQP